MKKLFKNILILTVIASLGLMLSCNKDEETFDAPLLTIESTQLDSEFSFEGTPGEPLSYTVVVTADAGFNTLYKDGAVEASKASGTTPTSFQHPVSYEIPDEVGTYTTEYYAVDEAGQESNRVTVTVVVTSPAARSYSTVLLTPPLDTKDSETFYSTNTGSKYTMNQVNNSGDPLSADIDFGYFYGSNTGATLSDPASYPFAYGQSNWGTLNSTTFRRTSLTASDFLEVVTWADLDAKFEAATAADGDPGIEAELAKGEVLAFQTDADKTGGAKRGLVLVVDYSGEATSNGKIELDILVQETATQ